MSIIACWVTSVSLIYYAILSLRKLFQIEKEITCPKSWTTCSFQRYNLSHFPSFSYNFAFYSLLLARLQPPDHKKNCIQSHLNSSILR